MTAAYPPIPYGNADFRRIRLEGRLYVDKTRFLRPLEQADFAVLIRPRRFGKSCWVSLLETYYDRHWAGDFDRVFAGTDIGARPTGEQSRYVVLCFDFSAFPKALPTLEQRFERYCSLRIREAVERHPDLFLEPGVRRILAAPSAGEKLNELFAYAGSRGIPLYVLVDEYDNFANTILAHRGEEAYRSFTHGEGFYRDFFATLKAGAGMTGGGLERLFITGVSPITLDDVTSGFNIGRNLSLDPDFNEVMGFTEAEVLGLLELYRERGVFDRDVGETLATMREWYDGYRFAEDAETTVYNTDMVLYYLDHAIPNRSGPRRLMDQNVRIDYGKLRHLLVVGRQLNGNFDLLREVAGEARVKCELQPGFPLERLAERENFLSLLHFFGLLSICGMEDGKPVLGIPNQTVKQLLFAFLRDGLRDVKVFSVDLYRLERLLDRMATRGEWRPVFDFLADAVEKQTGVRDYMKGEKVLQGFLAAYLGLLNLYSFRSEVELGRGYADLVLEPEASLNPSLRFGYLIELKYLRRSESLEGGQVEAAAQEAAGQLRRYLADEGLAKRNPGVRFVGLTLVFHGWELVRAEAVEPEAASAS